MINRRLLILIFSLFLAAKVIHAQINRPYEPIVITGDTLSLFNGYEINHLYLYAYHANTDSWELIPFQIDEVDTSYEEWDRYFTPERDSLLRGRLDFDDELVFMASDLGDKADSIKWVDDTDSLRCEIEFVDPINGGNGYVYLYRSISITDLIPSTYDMAFDSLHDRVNSANYELGFDRGEPDTTGQLSEVIIKSGTGVDIFDRQKIRAIGWWVFYRIYLDETNIKAKKNVYAKVGPVRIIRNMEGEFRFDLLGFKESFTQTLFFYPWSGTFKLVDIPIGEAKNVGAQVWTVRVSWDMNQQAIGMKFYSEFNRDGFLINGENDPIDKTCLPGEFNWAMATGDQGTMLNVFYIPPLGKIKRLYYYDNTDGKTDDNPSYYSVDTGDGLSFGDNGFALEEEIEKYISSDTKFNVIYYNFFLPPDFNPNDASLICQQLKSPLNYHTKVQKCTPPTAMVGNEHLFASNYALLQNYPNPFNPATNISFKIPKDDHVLLQIYDSLGKLINTLVDKDLNAGFHKYIWTGKDAQGISVPSGLYFCRLFAGNFKTTNKVMLIK